MTGNVLIGWSLVQVGMWLPIQWDRAIRPQRTPILRGQRTSAVTITFVINGNSSNTQIVAESTNTPLNSFDSMGIDPPDTTKYFKEWSIEKTKNTYKDRQAVSLAENTVLEATWADADEPAPAAPTQVIASKHLVNYGNDILNGHVRWTLGLDYQHGVLL